MKKIIVGLAALTLMGLPSSASAFDCAGPGSFKVCASISVGTAYEVDDVWYFDLRVMNLFPGVGVSHGIIGAGIETTQNVTGWALVGAKLNTVDVFGSGGWRMNSTGSPNSNLIGTQLEVFANTGAAKVEGGGVLVLTFSTGDMALNENLIDSYGWHSANVDGTGCSLWANSDGQYVGGTEAACSSVVPEPVSMVLLGTGLAGLGVIRRRRRKGFDIENA